MAVTRRHWHVPACPSVLNSLMPVEHCSTPLGRNRGTRWLYDSLLANVLVFKDHQRYTGEQAVFRLREVKAGDRLDALQAVGGSVHVHIQFLCRRLQAVVIGQVTGDGLNKVCPVLLVIGQQRSHDLIKKRAQLRAVRDLEKKSVEAEVVEGDNFATAAKA